MISSLRKAGVDTPIVGGDGFDTPNLLTPNDKLTKVWFTTHAWLSKKNKSAEMQNFLKAYHATYGQYPSDAFAALGYDAANLLITTMNKAKSSSPQAVLKALENTKNFTGVTGSISI